MRMKTIIPITEARKNIFLIAEEVQKGDVYYTLTERGKPKVVVIAAEKFESLMKNRADDFINSILAGEKKLSSMGYVMADEARKSYEDRKDVFSKALVFRDDSLKRYSYKGTCDLKYLEGEYIKSVLYVKLIDEYKYPLASIELGVYIKANGKERKRYIEADIIICDKDGNAEIIFENTSFGDYEKNRGKIMEDLFDIANTINWGKGIKYLVYYSRSNENDVLREKISVINYKKYKNFSSWKKAGMPAGNKIPEFLG